MRKTGFNIAAAPIIRCMTCCESDPFASLRALAIASRRSEEHTSELQSPYVISYAVFCLKTMMQDESAFNARAVSPVGALGLMQRMPDVAKELGFDYLFDPRQNTMAGSKSLPPLLASHHA